MRVQKTGCLKVILERTMASVPQTGARCGIVILTFGGKSAISRNGDIVRTAPQSETGSFSEFPAQIYSQATGVKSLCHKSLDFSDSTLELDNPRIQAQPFILKG